MQAGLVTIQLSWWVDAFQPFVATSRSLHSLRLDNVDTHSVLLCCSIGQECLGCQFQCIDWLEDLQLRLKLVVLNEFHVYDVIDEAEKKAEGAIDKVEETQVSGVVAVFLHLLNKHN